MKQRYQRPGTPQRITKAATHIRLSEVNAGKLAALNQLAPVYLALCQQYVTLFCIEEHPDKFHAPVFPTPLTKRWHRVAIQQGSRKRGAPIESRPIRTISMSWQTTRKKELKGTLDPEMQEPAWREWTIPALRQTFMQANVNVAVNQCFTTKFTISCECPPCGYAAHSTVRQGMAALL